MLFIAIICKDGQWRYNARMPKRERAVPLAAAPKPNPYARKALYFTDARQREILDWCIWRTHVEGYETLQGAASASSDLIHDLIKRRFLQDMLDEEKMQRFHSWRSAYGGADEFGKRSAMDLIRPMERCDLSGAGGEPNNVWFIRFMNQRCAVTKRDRLEILERQGAKCALCQAPKPVRIVQFADAVESPDTSHLIALCACCYDLSAGTFVAPKSARKRGRPRRVA